MRLLLAASAAAFLLSTSALAQSTASGGDKAKSLDALHSEAMIEQAKSGYADAPVDERTVQTRHSASVSGRVVPYTATAGTLTIRDVSGKPKASIFYTAYTADGAPSSRRPVMFFYNGGPGSASLWLRMGSFGPMRLQTGNPESIRPAPFNFGPNPDTLLGATDMVFIDAPGTGYSRPLGDAKGSDFYGVDQDADAFAKAIIRYTTKFGRWDSPKFLFGESYGTTRSGALAYQLQDRGLALNGVVLLSSIMNYGRRQPGLDRDYLNYLPSYAATAWYHHKMSNPPATVEQAAALGRAFAQGPYAVALEKGQTISPEERNAVAQQMSGLTGLSPEFIERVGEPLSPADLKPEHCIALFKLGTNQTREWLFRKNDVEQSIRPNAPLTFSDPESAVIAAVSGAGFVRALDFTVEAQIASGLLKPVLEDWNDGAWWPVAVVYPQHRQPTAKIRAFIEFCLTLFPQEEIR